MDLRFKSFPPLRCCFDLGRGKTLETKETKNCRISGLAASGHITLDRGYKALQLHIVFKLIQISLSTYQINMFVVLPYKKIISPKQQIRNCVYYPWKRFQSECFRYLGFTGSPLVWNQSVRSVAFLEAAPICQGRCKLAFVEVNEVSFMFIFFIFDFK